MKANSNITWRKTTLDDYNNILVEWWKAWGWEYFPTPQQISEGYIVSKNGVDTYSSFLYYSGTQIAWMGFTVSNKDASVEDRRGCFDELMRIITTVAKDRGVTLIFADAESDAYVNSLKRNGFIVGDKKSTHMIKKL